MISTRAEFNFVSGRLRLGWITPLAVGLYLVASVLRAGTGPVKTDLPAKSRSSVKNTGHAAKDGSLHGKAKSAARGASHGASRVARSTQSSRTRDEVRRSAMRPEPQRVQEIQRALMAAGELHEEPTGTWDQATSEAMKRYQERHGFNATGLPDSKSLMEMGLGPHPLPPEVAAANRASLGPPITSAPLSVSGSEDPPANTDPLQQHR